MDKVNKLLQLLDEDAVQNFINNMIEESKYCSEVIKIRLNKELVTTKIDDDDVKNSTKYWICDNTYVYGGVKIRDYNYITGKIRSAGQRDCNINVKLHHKNFIFFNKIKLMFVILSYKK